MLVFGKNGQIGNSLRDLFPEAVFFDSTEAPFLQTERVLQLLERHRPQLIINAAAYTQVDRAETDREAAWQVNAETPGQIASWCHRNQCRLVHFSTDYVLQGVGQDPQDETTPCAPVNWYGETKLEGERALLKSGADVLILRLSWVYADFGKNFLLTMLRLAREGKPLRVVSDQVGSPTFARDVAAAMKKVVTKPLNGPRVLHFSGGRAVSWWDFANLIFREAQALGMLESLPRVEKILTRDFPTAAGRPLNSRMNNSRFLQEFGVILPPMEESVRACLQRLQNSPSFVAR